MKSILLTLLLAAAAASAGTFTIHTTAEQDAALTAIATRENAARAAKLAEANKQRDAALRPLTAEDIGLPVVTEADVLVMIVAASLKPEAEKIEASAKADRIEKALTVVEAIKVKAVDCAAKAEAAGLDPLVCK